MALIFALVILTLILLFILTRAMSRALIDNSVLDMNNTIVAQTAEVFETMLDESARMGAYLLNSGLTAQFMFMDRSDAGMGGIRQLAADERAFPLIYRYIHSIYIYSEVSGSLISSLNGLQTHFADTSWLPAYYASSDHEIPAVSRTGPNGYPYFLSVVMPYYFYVTEKKGAVVINIDMEKLDRAFVGKERFNQQRVYITDQSGNILYCKDKSLISSRVEGVTGISGFSAERDTTVFTEDENRVRYIVASASLKNRGWKLVSVLPLNVYDTHFRGFAVTMRNMILILSLLGVSVTLIIAVKTYAPVKNVIVDLEKRGIQGGGQNRALTEMEYIKSLILSASQDNRSMRLELDKRMALLEQAQAGALQAQITPHFLANTLDAIRWGAVRLSDGENDVSRMICLLSLMFKASLDMKNMLVSVRDEVEYGKLYMEIMSYRYTNLVTARWDIDGGIMGLTAMKLSFQPILENAIYHGIKPKKTAGTITVTGYSRDGLVHILFADDGAGLTPAEAERINRKMSGPAALLEEHVGMHNVNQRLKLVFGEEYGASISSGENGGAVVELVFPVMPIRL